MKGNKLCLCFLLAAGVGLGAHAQNKIAAPMKDVNQVVDNTLDSLNVARSARPVSGSSRKGDNPVLFLVGNSTMRTGTLGNGNNGQWGWGYFEHEYFDENKITVENHALGGTSSRTFYNRLWPDVLKGVRKGDWVIIELGHNDNGPYDSGRARASIPGIGKDSLNVTIKETGAKETVYTYGEYMRRFIHDVKKKGAHPILMSLTPRNAWEDADSTIITRVNQTFGLWAKQVAKKARVPFIDLNDISARKFEKFGKEKVKYMFYLDRIHTSAFGARVNAESAAEGIRNYKGLELARYLKPVEKDTVTGATRKKGNPVLFTVGDSTVKNADKDEKGMWGWGSVIHELFDTERISVENHAKAGRSARTYLDEGRWDKIYHALQPGDFVFVTHYPSKKRPFYAMDDPADEKFTLSFDLLFKGLEVTTGGQRIHDYQMLKDKIAARGMDEEGMEQYLDTFKHGMPPHGGLGIGLERLTMQILGEENVRETCLFPRDMNRLEP